MTHVIATTTSGQVRGTRDGDVSRFMAVPYAAAPVGALRFAAPAPMPAWDGVRDATHPGPNAPQMVRAFPGLDISPLVGTGWRKGDDFLNLCIWTPDIAAKGLPVMVFIHGGAFAVGGADSSVQDGTAFARSGVVLMSITYRMGVEGFTAIPGAPTNLGLRDQIAALTWVRDNAATFGGDPANITVFGESAGAMCISDLVASPLAQGLFQKAIIESGHGGMVRPIPIARRLVDKMAKVAGVTPDVAGFRTLSLEQGVALVEKAAAPTFKVDLRDESGSDPTYGLSKFLPVYGDDVLPDRPTAALAKGVGKDIHVLIGANTEEMNLYFVPTGVRAKVNRLLAWFLMRRSVRHAWAILGAYGMGQKGRQPGDVFGQAMSDLVFRYPARQFAAAHQGATHVYDFGWRSTACGGELGACHGLELPFVFKTLASCTGPEGLAGEAPPQELADRIHKVWVDFARSGTLPWPEYEPVTRQVCALESGKAQTDPEMPCARFVG